MATTSERVGRNEALFREVNERIKEVSESLRAVSVGSGIEFICECSHTDCHGPIQLELADYERVREHPERFVVAPGHLWAPETERVVEQTDRYWVLEKFGDAGDVADAADPRS